MTAIRKVGVCGAGGTMGAAVELVNKVGGETIGCSVVIELEFLAGRDRLVGTPVTSLIRY